jgi:hypothetical protein
VGGKLRLRQLENHGQAREFCFFATPAVRVWAHTLFYGFWGSVAVGLRTRKFGRARIELRLVGFFMVSHTLFRRGSNETRADLRLEQNFIVTTLERHDRARASSQRFFAALSNYSCLGRPCKIRDQARAPFLRVAQTNRGWARTLFSGSGAAHGRLAARARKNKAGLVLGPNSHSKLGRAAPHSKSKNS